MRKLRRSARLPPKSAFAYLKTLFAPITCGPMPDFLSKRKYTALAAVLASMAASGAAFAAAGSGKRLQEQLRKLDPSTRLEQVCDIEAMRRINRDPNAFHPDRAVISAISDPKIAGHVAEGTGGAFRSKGKWYRFSFKCQVSDDHMRVLAFDYKLGDPIPESQWAKDGLWE